MGCATAPAGTRVWAASCPAAYRPRNPRASSLYQLLETPKRPWEACKRRFERRYGFWPAYWDSAVFSYMDCGLFESGFARVVVPSAASSSSSLSPARGEPLPLLLAALFSQLLQSKILQDIPRAPWVFTIPKMLKALLPLPPTAPGGVRRARLRNRPRDDGEGAVVDASAVLPCRDGQADREVGLSDAGRGAEISS
jgi:hypothetical protein